jgi:hypothetical protein
MALAGDKEPALGQTVDEIRIIEIIVVLEDILPAVTVQDDIVDVRGILAGTDFDFRL